MDCQATSSLCLTQSDLTPFPVPGLVPWPAQRLLPAQRQNLAVQVLAELTLSQRWLGNIRSAVSSSISKPTPQRTP